jgi:CBS-domain-containing membrane protein
MADVLRGLIHRFQMSTLQQHHSSVALLALFSFVNGCLSIAVMSIAALVTGAPFIFPSLGPTAFLFFYTPTAPAASPRNTLLGHAIGAAAGWFSLQLFGLENAGPAIAVGMDWQRVLAAALSLGLTSGLMVLLRAPHPPAGATTLIVSLGILPHLWQLGVLMLAVVLLTVQAFCINRLAGLPYPIWSASTQPASPPPTRTGA